ncbi:MAG: Gfo/Idh/MocA family oxidoreductase [Bacteroidetes bacterium]|nr:Gfo/Idh/MocA family oxidoreductase [Bacteroidota bacterium]
MKKNIPQNSRRDFIKNTSLALAGFYIVPRHVLGGKGFIAPSDKLLIAGIGAGGKGESDLWNFYQSGKAEIVALCDVDERQCKKSRERFPKAKFYKDYREMLEKEHANIDACSVSTPDHNHAVQAMAAMQLKKHVYVQKPMAHDIYEARMMVKAAKEYKVVTQMGNQGASGDGVRQLIDWYKAGLIGEVHTVYCYTDRPVWAQGVAWPKEIKPIPQELDWNLWLGTAPYKEYTDGILPFDWRGWWNYGTGALGDMGCHIIDPAYQVLNLSYPISAECSVATRYTAPWTRASYPESGPVSSHITLTFLNEKKKEIKMHWMDGGIQPDRPEELGANEVMGDGGNGVLFIGTKGKMMCGTYAENPQLLPTKLTKETKVKQTIERVKGSTGGHYAAWVEACIDGFGSEKANKLSSRFDVAGPLTEIVLMGNLAIRSNDIKRPKANKPNEFEYPGRYIKLLWDGPNMRITNLEEANQFVKRNYREGFGSI